MRYLFIFLLEQSYSLLFSSSHSFILHYQHERNRRVLGYSIRAQDKGYSKAKSLIFFLNVFLSDKVSDDITFYFLQLLYFFALSWSNNKQTCTTRHMIKANFVACSMAASQEMAQEILSVFHPLFHLNEKSNKKFIMQLKFWFLVSIL